MSTTLHLNTVYTAEGTRFLDRRLSRFQEGKPTAPYGGNFPGVPASACPLLYQLARSCVGSYVCHDRRDYRDRHGRALEPNRPIKPQILRIRY